MACNCCYETVKPTQGDNTMNLVIEKLSRPQPNEPTIPAPDVAAKWPDKPVKFRCPERKRKISKRAIKCLHPIVGVTLGALSINDFLGKKPLEKKEIEPAERRRLMRLQGFATCLIAFGETYITPEEKWSILTLNSILDGGMELFKGADQILEGKMEEVNQIPKCFTICQNGMEVAISEPIIIGTMDVPSSRVYNFDAGLCMFMRNYNYCLVRVQDRFFLVWKKSAAYLLFDCYGRNEECRRDWKNGQAALICVCGISQIDTLITYMGGIKPNAVYTLYEIRMKRILPCCKQPIICSPAQRKEEFEVISPDHAVLHASYHLGTDCFGYSRFKQGLAMGLVAIVFSKIDPPCTWDSNTVNRVLIIGDRRCKAWTNFSPVKCLKFEDIPRTFLVGQFLVEMTICPKVVCGNWIQSPNHRFSELSRAIRVYMGEKNCANILVQVDRRTYAIMKRHGYFYLFNPHPMDLVIAAQKMEQRRNATFHMFSSLNLLCCEMAQGNIGVVTPCKFFIHIVKIFKLTKVNIQTKLEPETRTCVTLELETDETEVASLNESIYDIDCEDTLKCTMEDYDIGLCDLDVPPLTETLAEPMDLKSDSMTTTDLDVDGEEGGEEGEEESEEESGEEEGNDSESDIEEGGGGKGKGQGKGKGKGQGIGKGKGKGKGKDKGKGKGDGAGDTDGKGGKGKGKGKDKGKGQGKGKGKGEGDEKQREKGGGKNKDKGKGKDKDKHDEDEDAEGKGKGKGSKGKGKDKDKDGKDKDKHSKGKDKDKDDQDKDKGKDKKDKDKDEAKGKDKDKDKGKDKHTGGGESDSESDGEGHGKGHDKGGGKGKKPGHGSDGDSSDKNSSDGDGSSSTGSSTTGQGKGHGGLSPADLQAAYQLGIEPPGGWPKGSGCIPNSYPGHSQVVRNLAVIGSETGSYQSLCQLIRSGLQVADRILTMTAWGNYVVFKSMASYLLYDGCTCNPCRFRNVDLSVGTAGLLCFDNLHDLIMEILKGKNRPSPEHNKQFTVDDICKQYC